MRRPALIFDFGNVIAYFDFEKTTTQLGERLGVTGRDLLRQLIALGFTDHLREYERGAITAVEFSSWVTAAIELTITHDDFTVAWSDIFTPNQSIVPLIRDLDFQGYSLLLGSNTNDLHARRFRQQFVEVLACFDHLVLSYEVGHVKPTREFFQACVTVARRSPGDCIFIDDLPDNVAGAEAAGLVGILYESTEQLKLDLRRQGIQTS